MGKGIEIDTMKGSGTWDPVAPDSADDRALKVTCNLWKFRLSDAQKEAKEETQQ